ncbi:MAG: bifunctional pyr operon transcriptional regulator/uracil phosphoribosyltransferase PyrR [Flavobacteriales bacterium]|nr:bifunctional pyr operon transcriptional regulator/uracil phosphoribosyltransferase PyrR [Flavobacteriales bacterium]
MESRIILDSQQLNLSIERICYQLIENHNDFSDTVLVGLQPRGVFVAQRIHKRLEDLLGTKVLLGSLDITFNRDDHRRHDLPLIPSKTKMDFLIEGKNVIMIDDVLFTGRTIRAGMDAMMAFGRPSTVELVVLVDRRFTRQLPIEPNYVGARIDTIVSERVEVALLESGGNDTVKLYSPEAE